MTYIDLLALDIRLLIREYLTVIVCKHCKRRRWWETHNVGWVKNSKTVAWWSYDDGIKRVLFLPFCSYCHGVPNDSLELHFKTLYDEFYPYFLRWKAHASFDGQDEKRFALTGLSNNIEIICEYCRACDKWFPENFFEIFSQRNNHEH